MNKFLIGVTQGLREGALVFVAPVVGLCRLFNDTAHDLIEQHASPR